MLIWRCHGIFGKDREKERPNSSAKKPVLVRLLWPVGEGGIQKDSLLVINKAKNKPLFLLTPRTIFGAFLFPNFPSWNFHHAGSSLYLRRSRQVKEHELFLLLFLVETKFTFWAPTFAEASFLHFVTFLHIYRLVRRFLNRICSCFFW